MDKGTERVRFRLFSGAVWLEQKSKGVGQNQARGLKWPTKRQRLYPKGSEEFPRTPQAAAWSCFTEGQAWSWADSEGL